MIPRAEQLLDVTYRGAQLNVEKLIDAGILRQLRGGSYGKSYIAEEILRVVSDQTG